MERARAPRPAPGRLHATFRDYVGRLTDRARGVRAARRVGGDGGGDGAHRVADRADDDAGAPADLATNNGGDDADDGAIAERRAPGAAAADGAVGRSGWRHPV